MERYYKIVNKSYRKGKIISSLNNIDFNRIRRYEEVKIILELIYNFSLQHNTSIHEVLNLLNKSDYEIGLLSHPKNSKIFRIKDEIKSRNFKRYTHE